MNFNNTNKKKILKMLAALAAIVIIFSSLAKLLGGNTKTLSQYASENPEIAHQKKDTETASSEVESTASNETMSSEESTITEETSDILQENVFNPEDSSLIGTSLNGNTMVDKRISHTAAFYYEPLSDHLRRYITGVSFPKDDVNMTVSYDELKLVHILHYDFEGNPAEGELICNEKIAQDLVEIFYELYQNEYQIEKVLLIDAYDGDDSASMEDNNTSCFNYRVIEGSDTLSKHALGLAVDINPLFNPYITYPKDSEVKILPASAQVYADRSNSFPYKIDEDDLCYKLFTEHGFTWGGNWNSSKDYQHFQKKIN